MKAPAALSGPDGRWWRIAVTALLLVLAVLITRLQMANYFAQHGSAGSEAAIQTALWWQADHPVALEAKAKQRLALIGEDTPAPALLSEITQLLQQALAADPSRGTLAAMLALVTGDQNDSSATEYASLANRLAPVEPRVQRDLATFALRQQDLAAAVVHMARAMVGAPESAARYYPVLMQVAADPQAREVLTAIAADPRPFPWWLGFFAHVAREADNLDALRNLVTLREASIAFPLQERERNYYIDRLRREGLVAEAYLHWANGLSREQLQSLGYLYDGSFEHEFANDAGFGWVVNPPRNSGIRVRAGDTYGASGDRALRLSFSGKRVRFSHIYQHLFLAPGSYSLVGRVRPEQLVARRGLQWRVYCVAGVSGTLGESELFVGTGDWRRFELAIDVPGDCSGQMLRLYSAGNREVDHELDGAIWFDDLEIRLQK